MKNKYLSIIIFTLAFAVSIVASVGAAVIDKKMSAPEVNENDITTINTIDSQPIDSSNETTSIGNNHNSNSNNLYNDIINQILGKDSIYETVLSPNNVGGKNNYTTEVLMELGGETVTIVFETETTSVETTISDITIPEETTREPVRVPITFDPPVTTAEPVVTTMPTVEETTIAEETTDTDTAEETTGNLIPETEPNTESSDNHQSEDSI